MTASASHLATIIPIYFTDDRYTDDCHYRGGAMRCYYNIGAYGASMIGMNAMPPYPEFSGADWARIWEEHLDNNTPYLLEWLARQCDTDYWRPGSLRGRYDQIQCPVFMIGGWCDHWLKGEDNAVMDEPPVQIYMQTFDPPRADRTYTGDPLEQPLEILGWPRVNLFISSTAPVMARWVRSFDRQLL